MRYAFIVVACLLLSVPGAFAGDDDLARVYRVPRYEAAHVIADWLTKAGYEVRSEQAAEKVVITASKGSSLWEIVLRHDSPMATEVTSGNAPAAGVRALWKFLSDYQQAAVSGRGSPAFDVPSPVKRRRDAVVCIRAQVKGRPIQLSGFVADTSGLILCTAHTLKDPAGITVTTSRGEVTDGRLVRIDFRMDLALIDCTHAFGSAIEVNNGRPVPDRDQRLYSIGCPRNHSGTMMTGVVSGPPRLVDGHPLLAVRMEVEPGSSGSPVFDEAGNLVGMIQGRMKDDHLSGLLIPVETIISFIKEK